MDIGIIGEIWLWMTFGLSGLPVTAAFMLIRWKSLKHRFQFFIFGWLICFGVESAIKIPLRSIIINQSDFYHSMFALLQIPVSIAIGIVVLWNLSKRYAYANPNN